MCLFARELGVRRSLCEDSPDAEREAVEEEEDEHKEVHPESVLQWVIHFRSAVRTNTGTSWDKEISAILPLYRSIVWWPNHDSLVLEMFSTYSHSLSLVTLSLPEGQIYIGHRYISFLIIGPIRSFNFCKLYYYYYLIINLMLFSTFMLLN